MSSPTGPSGTSDAPAPAGRLPLDHAQVVGFDRSLGLTFLDASGDAVRARIDVTPALHQPFGIVHGGVYCAVVETVASYGAALWFGDRGSCVGVTNTTHFVRAVREGSLAVEATPLQRGRTQQLWQVFVTDQTGRLVAKGEVRLANVTDPDRLGRPAGHGGSSGDPA